MAQIFGVVLSLSVSGALVGLIILLIRPVTRKIFSKKWTYYLWLLVLIRLLIPVHADINIVEQLSTKITQMGRQWESTDSTAGKVPAIMWENERADMLSEETDIMNAGEIVGAAGTKQETGQENPESAGTKQKTEQQIPKNTSPETGGETVADKRAVIFRIAAMLWIVGIILSAVWKIRSYQGYSREIRSGCIPITNEKVLAKAVEIQVRLRIGHRMALYESQTVDSPMLIGLIQPYIILPSKLLTAMSGREYDICLILHHELVHYKRRDIWYKWLFQAVVCVHWFNPFVYLFQRKFHTDCELACDEMVMALLSEEGRKAYGNVLLDVADKYFQEEALSAHKDVPAMTLLEEKRTLKERLRGIAQYHKKGIVMGVCSVAVLAVLCSAAVICGVSGGRSYAREMFVLHNDGSFMKQIGSKSYRIYDDDTLIAGACESDVWRAYNYCGGSRSVECQKFDINGSDILWIVYANQDTTLEMTSSFALKRGRFKIVQVMPDQTVRILNENGEKITEEVTLPRGRNCFKIVGQKAHLENFNITYDKEEEKVLSGFFRSEDEEYAYRVQLGQEPLDESRLGDIYVFLEAKEISELCRTAWESDVALSDENWQEIFIYSDGKLTSCYLLEALQAGKIKEFDSRILCMIGYHMDRKDVSECFRYLLERGKVAQSDWEDIFIYSDTDLSAEYLVKALQNGKGSGFNGEMFEEIGFLLSSEKLTDIVLALNQGELSFENLDDYVMYDLDEEQNAKCIIHYIHLGNVLTDSQLREIKIHVSEKDFYRIVEENGKNK